MKKTYLLFLFPLLLATSCANKDVPQSDDSTSSTSKEISLTMENMNYYLDFRKVITTDSPRSYKIYQVTVDGAYSGAIYKNCFLTYIEVNGTFTVDLSASGGAVFSYKQNYSNNTEFAYLNVGGTIIING